MGKSWETIGGFKKNMLMTSFYSPLLYLPARVSGLTCEKNGYFLYWHLDLKTNFCGISQQSEIWIDKNSHKLFLPMDFVIFFRILFLNNWKNSAYFFGGSIFPWSLENSNYLPQFMYMIIILHFFFFLISDSVTADGLAIAHSRESSVVSGIFSMSPKCNNR